MSSLLPEKKLKLCMTFRAWFYRTDPQNIAVQFGTLSGFLRNTFRKRTSQKKPQNMFLTEKFTGKVENLHAHVNRNLQHANPNLHVL